MARHKTEREPLTRQPRGPSRKNQARRKTVLVFYGLLALFVIVGAILAIRLVSYSAARDEYAAYQAADAGFDVLFVTIAPEQTMPPEGVVLVSPSPAPGASPSPAPFYSAKVASLRKDNREAVAWLDILGTEMQYPVVQGKDNEYYMTHTFKKKKNDSGAIFVDCWNAPDFTDFNTVIYGHNMNDGSMFAGLREYRHQNYFDKHSTIEITVLNKKLTYRVFAAYTSQGEDSADFRGQTCATEAERSAFIKAARKRSTELRSSLSVSRNDRILTLVTCTSGTHPWYWVVHAVLVEEQTMAE